ncbi:MAG: Lrp/AsnC family transcriptional regulator [Candidatus Dormiibacterota bacterium]
MTAKVANHLTNRNRARGLPQPAQAASLDATDLAILVSLLQDARGSVRQIAYQVGMSAPAVAERIARLERSGVIRGYRAEVDWGRLGFGVTAYVAVTGVQGWEQVETVSALRALPEVENVEIVTGASDLLVRLRVRDQQHLRDCLFDRVWRVPGVHRTETLLCLSDQPPKAFDLELAEQLVAVARAEAAGARAAAPRSDKRGG